MVFGPSALNRMHIASSNSVLNRVWKRPKKGIPARLSSSISKQSKLQTFIYQFSKSSVESGFRTRHYPCAEGVVLDRVVIWGDFCLKKGQGLKPEQKRLFIVTIHLFRYFSVVSSLNSASSPGQFPLSV